jgi:hypothetical protein
MSIRAELLALVDDEGLLQPPVVHDWARTHPKSDLHARLDWDDAAAGYQYRLTQIRQLITITVRTADHKPQMISLSIDRADPGGGYRQIAVVMQNRKLRQVALHDALSALEHLQFRYGDLAELAPIWQHVHQLKKETTQDVRKSKQAGLSGAERSVAPYSYAKRAKQSGAEPRVGAASPSQAGIAVRSKARHSQARPSKAERSRPS